MVRIAEVYAPPPAGTTAWTRAEDGKVFVESEPAGADIFLAQRQRRIRASSLPDD
jgi:hypothetical protein